MSAEQIGPGIYVVPGGVNLGLVIGPEGAIAIDAGLDKDAAKRIAGAVNELDVRLSALLITHSHADHSGGAEALRSRSGCEVWTSAFEKAIVENPELEGLYLFSGAHPVKALTNKFYLAKPCRVDKVVASGRSIIAGREAEFLALPGHSPGQIGLAIDGILFAGDAVFPQEVLAKHRIPFFTDIDASLSTCRQLLAAPPGVLVPGHGAVQRGEQVLDAIQANLSLLEELRARTWELLASPASTAEVLQGLAAVRQLALDNVGSYCLAYTTAQALCASLVDAGEAVPEYTGNVLRWRRQ